MPDRYFIAVDASDDRQAVIRTIAQRAPDLVVLVDRPGLIVVSEVKAIVIRLAHQGLIIGALHAAGRREALSDLSPDMVATIAANTHEHLVRAYWGNYVALFTDTPSRSIQTVRAPLGTLPCLYVKSGQGWIIGSDVNLLTRLGDYRASVDWEAVLRFALAPDVRTQETCLAGLREVRGGNSLNLTDGAATETTIWAPWPFAERERQIFELEEAARRLRDTIVSSTNSLATNDRSIVLLSGGLDSSIVSATAAALNLDARCLTISTNDASGDERSYAKQTTDHVGLPLSEARFELRGVDLEVSGAARLPRAVARAFECEGRRQSKLIADAVGADAVLSGGGGDNVFCSLQSVAPAVDCLAELDGLMEFARVARELSMLTNSSLFTVVRRAFSRSLQPNRPYPKPSDVQFLQSAAAVLGANMPRHPWLQRPASIPQGKGAHVAALLGVQPLAEDSDPQDPLALRYPLLAQPIVELCLRIPTWLWYDLGCNRAVARHAFSHDLPPGIAWRRSKGTPDGFVVEIFDTKRKLIREMLLEGNLAGHGLLDLPSLTTVLDDLRPVRGTDHGRVMRLLDIEAWTRAWPR